MPTIGHPEIALYYTRKRHIHCVW